MLMEWSESLVFILSNMHESAISRRRFCLICSFVAGRPFSWHSLFFVLFLSDFQPVVWSVLDGYLSQIIDTPNQILLQ